MKEQMVRRVIMILYRLCAPTWRIIEEYVEGEAADVRRILNGETPASVLFAHGKMFPLWYHLRSTNGAPIISVSSDGERLAWVLRHALGYRRIIRGSSSSGGAEVLEALERTLAAQSTLMTPDGPRGPRNEPKAGGIVAAPWQHSPLVGKPCMPNGSSAHGARIVTPLVANISEDRRQRSVVKRGMPGHNGKYLRFCITFS